MIAQISGKIVKQNNNSIFIDVAGICYEVFVPTAIMRRLDKREGVDGCISLLTYHYHNVEPSRSVPVLIGFLNDIEKDFFSALSRFPASGQRPRSGPWPRHSR